MGERGGGEGYRCHRLNFKLCHIAISECSNFSRPNFINFVFEVLKHRDVSRS